jgi:periplasmic protein CpxP/Spy
MPISTYRAGRIIATAAFLPAILFAVSSHAVSASEYLAQNAATSALPAPAAPPAPATGPKVHSASADRIDARIAELHKQLRITPDQEALWNDLAQVMLANGRKMRDSVAERSAKLKTMNAVDDLKSYEMITDEHADGLKRLIPAFEALYAKMSPAQQKNADHVFGAKQRQASRQAARHS